MKADLLSHQRYSNLRPLAVLVLAVVLFLGGSSLFFPSTVQADPDLYEEGDVFASVGNGLVKRFDSDGTYIETLETTSGSEFLTGLCLDSADNLYTTNFSSNNMSKFDETGMLVEHPWGGPFTNPPTDCVSDFSGNIYVSEGGATGALYKFDVSGTLLDTYNPMTDGMGISGLALAADACTMYYTARSGAVQRYDVCTDTQMADFATGLGNVCYQLDLRLDGEVVAACGDAVHEIDNSGTVTQTYTELPDSFYYALTLDPGGETFWTADRFSGEIYEVNIDDGTIVQQFNAGLVGPQLKGLVVFHPQEFTAISLDTFDAQNAGFPLLPLGLGIMAGLTAAIALIRRRGERA